MSVIGSHRPAAGHFSPAWRPAYCDAHVHESLAQRVNVIDRVRNVAKITALAVIFGVPVPGQLDLRLVVTGRGEKDQ